jgi:hypothetical protein
MTVDTGGYVTAAGWPERQPYQCYTLGTVSGEALPIVKEGFLTMTLGRCPLTILVFIGNVTNKFILRMEIMWECNVSVDIWRQTLHLFC